jgi:molybdopterin converting factor small subunit
MLAPLEVRIRLSSSLAQLASAPLLRLELPAGATVEDLDDRLAGTAPELAPALASALPVLDGEPVERARTLAHGQEVALVTTVAGG